MKHFLFFAMLLGFGFSGQVPADTLVLIHGYLGSATSWETSGVNAALASQGWSPAGQLMMGPGGVDWLPGPGVNTALRTYAVDLPSLAPLALQADHLAAMLRFIEQRHGQEPMILAGHSAGGVVARLALVRGGAGQVKTLVTLASPHLGTERAIQALDCTNDHWPVSWVKRFFGGTQYQVVRDSWGVLLDLVPAQPGSLLGWLNGQTHPDIRYVSILRSGPVGLGDELVPIYSQDMNQVDALRGKSETLTVASSHALHPEDGLALAQLLGHDQKTSQGTATR